MDQNYDLRETKKHFVAHYGYHYWEVLSSEIELCYTYKASFQASPQTNSNACTIDAIKTAYYQEQDWITRTTERLTNAIIINLNTSLIIESPVRLRVKYTP